MNRYCLALALAFVGLAAEAGPRQPLQCQKGPASVLLAESRWLVYACEDGRSIVLVASPGSKASPSYISVLVQANDEFDASAEGTGDKGAMEGATRKLRDIGRDGISRLFAQASAAYATVDEGSSDDH
jgi:hypothetical protein